MAAQEKPNPEPKEPKEIQDFRAKYAETLDKARISADHTATEGWQNLYGEQRLRVSKRRVELSDQVLAISEALRHRMLSEDEEKNFADTKKEIVELRESDDAFRRFTVDPVIQPPHDCEKVMNDARATARAAERNAPLHARGLEAAMETVIGTMPHVKFYTASGKLTVGEVPTE